MSEGAEIDVGLGMGLEMKTAESVSGDEGAGQDDERQGDEGEGQDERVWSDDKTKAGDVT